MADVIIRQKDIYRLGKKLLNEMNDFLHDEYILTEFKEMKEVKQKFLKELAFNHINTLKRQYRITEEERQELAKPFIDKLFDNKNIEYDPNLVKEAMKDDGIDTEGIYHALVCLDLEMEINEDLYFKKSAFLDIYRVFETGYSYLED